MTPAPTLNALRAHRALRTGLAGALVLLAAAAARLVWPSGLHLAFIPGDADNALGVAEATGGDFPEDVTVQSMLLILGLRALSSLIRRGSPATAMRSASNPGARTPVTPARPIAAAARDVAASSTSVRGSPTASRALSPPT